MYDEVTKAIQSISIQNLTIKDKLFVNGMDIRNDKRFLPDIMSTPITHVSNEIIDEYIGKNDEKIRHYRVVQIPAWNGQLVLSIFFRFTKIGKGLFSEARFFILTPLIEVFLSADNLTKSLSFRQVREIVTFSFIQAFLFWVMALKWLTKIVTIEMEKIFGEEENKLKKENERYNYGQHYSLREIWAQSNYIRYFQRLDKDMYHKVIQQKLIDSITDSLDSRGISTEALKERITQILNNGVIVSGGKVKAGNLAIGKSATIKAFTEKIKKVAKNE